MATPDDAQRQRIDDLERLIGQLTVELDAAKTLRDAPLTLDAKRQLVAKHQSHFGVDLLCEFVEMSRSAFYYEAVEEVDDGVRAAIVRIAEEFPTYGYRMIQKELERRLVAVNA